MPFFPELRPYLEAVRDELLADFDPKAKRLSEQPVINRYRDANANLRTQLLKIIRRAGLNSWPKLFQNLRATRATDLADGYPTHVAADWLGHSTTIADKHYRQTTAEHFARALQSPTETDGSDGNEEKEASEESHEVRKNRGLPLLQVGDTGSEHLSDSSGITQLSIASAAHSGAVSLDSATIDPDLGLVVDAWPRLSDAVRESIVQLIQRE